MSDTRENAMTVTGADFIAAGHKPGKWFPAAIAHATAAVERGMPLADAVRSAAADYAPPPVLALKANGSFFKNIEPMNEHEAHNVASVFATMEEVMRTPVVKAGAIMPDACPAGSLGTIPVGGVVSSEAIHPGMHSADICCSMAASVFTGVDEAVLLNAVHSITHFGPGGRHDDKQLPVSAELLSQFQGNPFLRDSVPLAISHFGTQGDGNHFAYVGRMKSTGDVTLVTHHGSRGPGAKLYNSGMRAAEKYRQALSPETLKQNAWIPADTVEGDQYWSALQVIRQWTKESHFAIHDLAATLSGAKLIDRAWNEHNFVFRKTDGLFYHAKGATPAFPGYAADAGELTIIPMNMVEPILIVRGLNAENGLGFSPHGAGRNFSRTQHKRMQAGRTDEEIFAEETQGIDARFFMGIADISELPSAYKSASEVKRQLVHYGLAEIVDEVLPYGCIMAGDWERDAPWRKKKLEIKG